MDRGRRPAALETGRDTSPVRISINTSPGKRTTFVPSPTSPTKSISGAIMEGSHAALFTNSAHNSPEPQIKRESDASIPEHRPQPQTTHRSPPRSPLYQPSSPPYATPARSFFEPDSSSTESPVSQRHEKAPEPPINQSEDWTQQLSSMYPGLMSDEALPQRYVLLDLMTKRAGWLMETNQHA